MQYMKARFKAPTEIISFLESIFEIYQIRARVGRQNGVAFEIRTNEQNHSLPHVHAAYGEYNISMDIESGQILAGSLPKKNQKAAVDWVLAHKDKLLGDWKNIAISAVSTMTRTMLDFTN